jgi:Subtilase family
MPAESFDHIILSGLGRNVDFTPIGHPGSERPFPFVPNRREHSEKLAGEIRAVEEAGAERLRFQAEVLPKKERGLLVRFTARTEYGIDLSIFRKSSHRLELLSSRGEGKRHVVRAFAPIKSFDVLQRATEKFGESSLEDERQPRFSNFFEQIDRIEPAAVARLWNPPTSVELPKKGTHLWEVWVRPRVVRWLRREASKHDIELAEHETEFPTATVIRMRGSYANLSRLLIATAAVIEIRPASSLAPPPMDLAPIERVALMRRIQERLQPAPPNAARTTILDTGVRYQHALLRDSLPAARAHTLLAAWPPEDVIGHGTQMAGAALFGDLNRWIPTAGPIVLENALESVAMLGRGYSGLAGPTDLLDQAVRKVERNDARRVYSMSFRIPSERVDGAPTEFSSHIDQLAFARDGHKRLFCVPAGNLDQDPILVGDYIGSNDRLGIETPGQSVNALTVGAYTALTRANGHTAHAGSGDLCPTARTAICNCPGWLDSSRKT